MRTIGTLAILSALSLSSLALVACESGSGSSPTKDRPATGATSGKAAAAAKPTATAKAKGPFPQSDHEAMKDPTKASEEAPESFAVEFDTTAGKFSMSCTRAWAPNGVDRFYNLVKIGFFDDVAFFRAVKNFVVQFGIHGDPTVTARWRKANIEPDMIKGSNKKGTLTYAQAGRPAAKGMTAASRATQLFINLKDNPRLDGMGFAPICTVTEGMDVVTKLHTGYGERAGRDQANITRLGNPYLREKYPLLDYIKSARLVDGEGEDGGGGDDGESSEGDDETEGAAAAGSAAAETGKAEASPAEAGDAKAAKGGKAAPAKTDASE